MSTTTQPTTIHEPSAWLRAAASRRVAQVIAAGLDPHDGSGALIVAPLGRTTAPGTREDRTCDRCAAYVPEGPSFFCFTYRPAAALVLIGGYCTRCADRERVAR